MTRELGDGAAWRLEDAALEPTASMDRYAIDDEDDGDDDDDDFELETMEDDDDDVMEQLGVSVDDSVLSDVLPNPRDDRIAHRTRTKLSLVDVEMDLLESLLPPDAADSELFTAAEGDEYQRFLSSLLPTVDDDDNLSFLDEEGEEYHPEDDDEDDEEDEDGSRSAANKIGSPSVDDDYEELLNVRVSKKELTELLWDSTMMNQVKVPPTFPRLPAASGQKPPARKSTPLPTAMDAMDEAASLTDAAALKDINGTISQEQCIHLASQMHKHFQLLLQTYHLIASAMNDNTDDELQQGSPHTTATDDDTVVESASDSTTDVSLAELLPECESMLRDLQVRGKRALEHKAKLLSKLSNSADQQAPGAAASDHLEQRRVTRSISAAHAAVAHPSMFDIVGSQSMEQLTDRFSASCSISERNEALRDSMLELDKHLSLSRKKKRHRAGTVPRPVDKGTFTPAEDRLLLQGVKYYGVSSEAWLEIQDALLPTKSVQLISKRYRYLSSSRKRAGAKELKVHHNEYHSRRRGEWAIEEDVRIARGVVEYFGDNRRFARISGKYLPHRHRLEIRKRWGKLKKMYRDEDGSVVEDRAHPWLPSSKGFAEVVKTFMEGKLRAQAPAAAAEVVNQLTTAAAKWDPLGANGGGTKAAVPPPPPVTGGLVGCRAKNLHPSLFFSSWAVINPAMLLARTCEHNWPAFIEEKRKGDASASTLAIVSSTAVSRVEEETAQHRADLARGSAMATIAEGDEDEPSIDVLDEEDEEEDSEYEREELLSSEDDEGSSNSEYELMELSDDEEEEDDDEQEEGSDDGARLELQHLNQGSDGKKRRALEALERRLTGKKAVDHNGSSSKHRGRSFASPQSAEADDLDLFAYEELRDSTEGNRHGGEDEEEEEEEDDDFEQEELLGSSDEDSDHDVDGGERSKRGRELPSSQSPKRVKLSASQSRCSDCGGLPCVCASARMQRLLQRIQPRGAVISSSCE